MQSLPTSLHPWFWAMDIRGQIHIEIADMEEGTSGE